MARTFKTATMGGGYGTFGSNAKTLRDFVMQSPELLQQIGGEQALDAYIKEQQAYAMGGFGGENGLQVSADTQRIDDILNNYQMNSIGYAGMDDGRQKAIVKDGQTLFKGDPYSYKPAKDNLETVMRGAALIGGTAGLSSLVNGGLLGGAQSGVGIDAAGNLSGSSLMDGALAEAMTGAGSLAPEGVAALIPTGAQLGAVGGGSLLAGGLLGGGVAAPAAGAAATTGALDGLKKAGGKVADWAISNPKGAGALLGGLLGGAGGGSGGSGGGSGGGYTGPMPTITRGDWNANPQAQMMQVPQFGVQMPTKGQKSSGLLRFGG